MNDLRNEIVKKGRIQDITPDLIRDFNRRIGEGLSDECFKSDPGVFRSFQVTVGNVYTPPNSKYVEEYVGKLCSWLNKDSFAPFSVVKESMAPKPVKAIVASGMDASSLSDLAPVKDVEGVSVDEALEGVAARTLEPGALNALPESWREVLYETRFKAKLVRRLVAAGVVWLLAMSVLFGVPAVYGFMTDHQAALIKEHRRSYAAVSEMRDKVKVIRKYSDHAGGALESMRIVSEMMPDEGDGFVLTSWDFRRNEGMKVAGEADEKSMIYIFKNNLSGCGAFTSVGSPSIKQTKERYSFTIDLSFVEQEDAP